MSFNVQISDHVDKNKWDDTLLQNKASLTYQVANWQKMFHEVYGSKPFFISVTNSSERIVGQLAGVIHHKWYWRDSNIISKQIGNRLDLGKVLHWFYGPIIYDKSNQDSIITQILSALDRIAVENNVGMIRGISAPLEESFSPKSFREHKYKMHRGTTFIIDLRQGINQLYNSLKKDIRYYIRKAEKIGFEFEVVENRDALTEFEEINFQAMNRKGKKTIRNPTFFDKHWELLHKEGFEQLLVARYKGENAGGILTMVFNGNVIQHALANIPKNDLVGPFLTWNTIKWAIEKKYLTFDFAGVNPFPKTKKEKGIYYYASKWGGKLYDYTVYTKIIDRTKFNISSVLKNPRKILRINKIMT